MKKNKEIIIIFSLFIVAFILLIYNHTIVEIKYYNDGLLYINEVMPSNKFTIMDDDYEYSDYIELYNGYDYDINLLGYYLSDEDNFNTKWQFSDITIKKNDYLIVYASSKNKCNNNICHTNFKLDSKGETVTLTNSDNKVISKIKYKNTDSDTSYGYNGNLYVYYYVGTPNIENKDIYSNDPIKREKSDIKIRINEYTNNNVSLYKDEDKEYSNVIELYNYGDSDINMKDFCLTNKEKDLEKYTFPDITIKKNDYLTIYLSGKNKYNKEIHTNFTINNLDNTLILLSNKLEEIDRVELKKLPANMTSFLYNDEWLYSYKETFNRENREEDSTTNYVSNSEFKTIVINEVSSNAIELKNISNEVISLKNYGLKGNGSDIKRLPDIKINPNSYIVVYESDTYSYNNNRINIGFKIGNNQEVITLYDNFNNIIDKFTSGKLSNNISYGLNSNNERVIFNKITLGSNNASNYYKGYAKLVNFSIDGGYVLDKTEITLTSPDNGTIYYTIDGSFPTNKSLKYEKPIAINKTTVIKAICYVDGMLESSITSRTFIVGRTHDLAYISISTNNNDLFGSNGLLVNYRADMEKKISFEFYEADGTLGTSFTAGTKLTGMDSRERSQKSMAIYLRNEYGLDEVTYPFFKDGDTLTYSSFTLRNSGEDPYSIRIQDTTLTYALKGQMDIDMQDYRPVVVYLNGSYYGLYNMREKLNSDYIVSKYQLNKNNFDLIKYRTAVNGNTNAYNNLVNYVKNHNPANSDVYNYLNSQIDMQEFCNYLIVESYYGNTDLGNIRYWKDKNGKWRYMLYDLDWSLWNYKISMAYPILSVKTPAATYLSSTYTISRKLYNNSEFKDLYLKTLAYHLKNTFNPTRMNSIVDELAKEIEKEMPYHIERWNSMYRSMDSWRNNVNSFKNKLSNRYNYVIKNIKNDLKLSNSDFNKYFSDL